MSIQEQPVEGSSREQARQDGTRVVQVGCLVVMDYVVRLATGKVVDSSEKGGGPARFICGKGNFPRPVEEGIQGMVPGESKTITVHPYFGYGLYDPKKQMLVASERVTGPIEAGKVIKVPDELGITRPAVIREVWKGAIMVDFNHPLAGQVLKFEVSIRQVLEASDQEDAPASEEASHDKIQG